MSKLLFVIHKRCEKSYYDYIKAKLCPIWRFIGQDLVPCLSSLREEAYNKSFEVLSHKILDFVVYILF